MSEKLVAVAVMLSVALVALGDGIRIINLETDGGYLAGGFQVLVASLLLLFSLLYWFTTATVAINVGAAIRDHGVRLAILGFAIFVAYVAVLPVAGYMVSSTVAFLIYLRIYSSYRWPTIIAGSLFVGVGSAYLWQWLQTGLPSGFLPWP